MFRASNVTIPCGLNANLTLADTWAWGCAGWGRQSAMILIYNALPRTPPQLLPLTAIGDDLLKPHRARRHPYSKLLLRPSLLFLPLATGAFTSQANVEFCFGLSQRAISLEEGTRVKGRSFWGESGRRRTKRALDRNDTVDRPTANWSLQLR